MEWSRGGNGSIRQWPKGCGGRVVRELEGGTTANVL